MTRNNNRYELAVCMALAMLTVTTMAVLLNAGFHVTIVA